MTRDKMKAMILANALFFTTPPVDRAGATAKKKSWDSFMDTLDWDKATETKKPKSSANTLHKMFKGLGIVRIRDKTKQKKGE